MVRLHTKNTNLGIFLKALELKFLIYMRTYIGCFMTISCILQPFGIFCGHLAYIFPFWYIIPRQIC
jgi:hypothetical protein